MKKALIEIALLFLGALFLLAATVGIVMLVGCGTVRPRPPVDHVASFDGTNQNSGFIGFAPDGRGIITAHARDRYNSLIGLYGSQFLPPLKPDDGLSAQADGTWLMDQQHITYFADMIRWKREGK